MMSLNYRLDLKKTLLLKCLSHLRKPRLRVVPLWPSPLSETRKKPAKKSRKKIAALDPRARGTRKEGSPSFLDKIMMLFNYLS